MIRLYGIILSLLLGLSSCSDRESMVEKSKLLGNDYRLFQSSQSWELAKAVWDEDIEAIKSLGLDSSILNYQEGKYGKTLLMMSIDNQQYSSFKALLELGANLHVHNNYDGSSAIMYSVDVSNIKDNELKFLEVLLKYGANPNDMEVGKRKKSNTTRDTPLLIACGRNKKAVDPLSFVMTLVEAGADLDLGDEYGRTPLQRALFQDNLDVVLYLLEQGVNHRMPVYITPKGEEILIEKSWFCRI